MDSNFAIFPFIPLDDEILFVFFSFCFFFFTFFFSPPVEKHLTAISPEWSVKHLSSSSSKNLTLTFSTGTALSPLMQAELLIHWEPILRP
ncbi:unnamed protein product [Arctogadus glacialis]